MGDLISRQDAIEAIKKNTFRLTVAEEQNAEGHVAWSADAVYSDVMEGELLELPSAQPERKVGKWTEENACEFCGFKPWYERDIHTLSYCPNCGADMRGEPNE